MSFLNNRSTTPTLDPNMPPIMAEMLFSKMTHDLASPTGAVENGLELLEDDSDQEMMQEALSMIRDSASTVSARLRLYRLAYGTAAGSRSLNALAITNTLAAFFSGEKRLNVSLNPSEVDLPEQQKKLLFNLILCAASSLPRGGSVTAGWDAERINIDICSSSDGHPPKTDCLIVFDDHPSIPAELSPYDVQAYYTGWYARQQHVQLQQNQSGGQLNITARW